MKRRRFIESIALTPLSLQAMDLKDLRKVSDSFPSSDKMPVLFVGHGSPMNGIENNGFSKTWQDLPTQFQTPTAVICVSAHWLTRGTFITAMDSPKTIHDFVGFSNALY